MKFRNPFEILRFRSSISNTSSTKLKRDSFIERRKCNVSDNWADPIAGNETAWPRQPGRGALNSSEIPAACIDPASGKISPIPTSIRKWESWLYWLSGCSQRGQVQGSFVWNISNHFERVMRISLARNSLFFPLFPFPVTIRDPLACIFHEGGTNQLSLSLSLQNRNSHLYAPRGWIRPLIPLEEVASLRVTTVCSVRWRERKMWHIKGGRTDCLVKS